MEYIPIFDIYQVENQGGLYVLISAGQKYFCFHFDIYQVENQSGLYVLISAGQKYFCFHFDEIRSIVDNSGIFEQQLLNLYDAQC